jgi:hypothetical protein
MVERGVLPVDAAKEVVMAVIRRSRLGNAVEDAFDKMQPPKPAPDPKAAQAQAESQGAIAETDAKVDGDIKIAQIKAQLDAQVAQAEQNAQAQQNRQEQMLEQQRTQRKEDFDTYQAKLDAFVKIIVATISATKQPDTQVQPVADRTVASVQ